MTKVVHVITGLGTGGAERMLTHICVRETASRETEHVVVSLMDAGHFGRTLGEAGVRVHTLNMRRGRPSLFAVGRIARLLRAERPDIVMTWLYAADLLGTVGAVLARAPRLVWNIRCSDMDLSQFSRTTRLTVRTLSMLSGVPTAVATNSRAGRIAHERMGYRPRRWALLPNGVDASVWRPDSVDRAGVRSELKIPHDAVVFGMVARVDPAKDHATLFAAATRIAATEPAAQFLIVGRETDRLAIPRELGERLRAMGERGDVTRLMRALDVHVLSSHSEGFPNVVVEAMATAVPCIVSDVGDAAGIVGETGWVTPPRDADALEQAMREAIRIGAGGRAHRGGRARALIVERWSLDNAVARYQDLWRAAMMSN